MITKTKRVLPILFNAEMVEAILDNRKTCTRRVIKPQPDERHACLLGFVFDSTEKKDIGKFGFGVNEFGGSIQYAKPPYLPGDTLYVRETWNHYKHITGEHKEGYLYKASPEMKNNLPLIVQGHFGEKWMPSIHMPKEAARIWLKVTDVRVERLQNITEEDCEKEGVENFCKKCSSLFSECDTCLNDVSVKEEFNEIWDSTIKKSDLDIYGWSANPWVWVIEFERCEKPED